MIYTIQPKLLQRSLCTPLKAVAYTNEVLVVSAMLGTLTVLLLASYAGNIEVMSSGIARINDLRQELLQEKIDIISSARVGPNVIVTLTNYGNSDTVLLGFFAGDDGSEITTCMSNNSDNKDMTVASGRLLEVTCPVDPGVSKILIATDTQTILEARF